VNPIAISKALNPIAHKGACSAAVTPAAAGLWTLAGCGKKPRMWQDIGV
jgi:hypothetical protein